MNSVESTTKREERRTTQGTRQKTVARSVPERVTKGTVPRMEQLNARGRGGGRADCQGIGGEERRLEKVRDGTVYLFQRRPGRESTEGTGGNTNLNACGGSKGREIGKGRSRGTARGNTLGWNGGQEKARKVRVFVHLRPHVLATV